jgi:hypothetical protein
LLSRDNSLIPLRRRADPDLGLLTVATRHDVQRQSLFSNSSIIQEQSQRVN